MKHNQIFKICPYATQRILIFELNQVVGTTHSTYSTKSSAASHLVERLKRLRLTSIAGMIVPHLCFHLLPDTLNLHNPNRPFVVDIGPARERPVLQTLCRALPSYARFSVTGGWY
jgi:uncharacterized coiled-coil protein SlyX